MNSTHKSINESLDEIAKMMADKGIVHPRPNIQFNHGGRTHSYLHADSLIGGQACVSFSADSLDECFKQMRNCVEALPSAEEKLSHDYSTKLAHVIDWAKGEGVDDDLINPLMTTREALTKNLLIYKTESYEFVFNFENDGGMQGGTLIAEDEFDASRKLHKLFPNYIGSDGFLTDPSGNEFSIAW